MATVRDIVTRALRRSNLIGVAETPDGDEAAHALAIFNEMMHGLKAAGINLGWTDLALAGTLPLEDEYKHGVIAMLAVKLMDDSGDPPGVELRKDAMEGESALAAGYRPIMPLIPDMSLRRMPSQRRIQQTAVDD